MDDLVQWLGEQLDADERIAKACPGDGSWTADDFAAVAPELNGEVRQHIAEHDPARVLREIDAKRQLLALHSVAGGHECSTRDAHGDIDHCTWVMESEACTTLRLLALPNADRPGYLEKWRP
ncbi:DUF6221 family protein [Streptomyces sp. NPDC016845]|uniref:DUF6221 family protein n=1 Tax=Streptomyces sp. NPDC016845 TaxID=3364972 RepID=UPI00378D601F